MYIYYACKCTITLIAFEIHQSDAAAETPVECASVNITFGIPYDGSHENIVPLEPLDVSSEGKTHISDTQELLDDSQMDKTHVTDESHKKSSDKTETSIGNFVKENSTIKEPFVDVEIPVTDVLDESFNEDKFLSGILPTTIQNIQESSDKNATRADNSSLFGTENIKESSHEAETGKEDIQTEHVKTLDCSDATETEHLKDFVIPDIGDNKKLEDDIHKSTTNNDDEEMTDSSFHIVQDSEIVAQKINKNESEC